MDMFHRHRQADEHGLAAKALECALQTPEYRPEALVWKGIEALPQDPKLAFIFCSMPLKRFPSVQTFMHCSGAASSPKATSCLPIAT